MPGPYFDAHTHMDVRPEEDLERMAVAGVRKLLTLAHDPLPVKHHATSIAHWKNVLEVKETASDYLIDARVGLAVHPRAVPEDVDSALKALEGYLDEADAVGEIGLETASRSEREVFREQLDMAAAAGLPAVVHTPRSRDPKVLDAIAEDVRSSDVDPADVVVDHLVGDLAERFLDEGVNVGITVQPGKATPEEAVETVTRLSEHSDRILLNSDAARAPCDVLAVPRTAWMLEREGFDEVERVTYKNAEELFG